MSALDRHFLKVAIEEALKSAAEGGVPVGASLAWQGKLVSKGHNQRQQKKMLILHGETDCLANAGLFRHLNETTLYTSLSPCMMCSGTIVQFRIPRVVIADAVNFGGNEPFLQSHGVAVEIINDPEMISFFSDWKARNPEIWNGDIGEDSEI